MVCAYTLSLTNKKTWRQKVQQITESAFCKLTKIDFGDYVVDQLESGYKIWGTAMFWSPFSKTFNILLSRGIRGRGDEEAIEGRWRGDRGAMERRWRGYVIWIKGRCNEGAMKRRWRGDGQAIKRLCYMNLGKGRWRGHKKNLIAPYYKRRY